MSELSYAVPPTSSTGDQKPWPIIDPDLAEWYGGVIDWANSVLRSSLENYRRRQP